MKTMCPPVYQYSDFVAIDALGHMLSFHRTTVVTTRRAHCFQDS